mgnify:CR=1 FL=1
MRNVVMMAVSAILGVLSLIIVMSISGRSVRNMELKSNLSSLVEETVEEMIHSDKYGMDNVNLFIGDFIENLALVIDSDSELEVSVLQADKEKGILTVSVTEKFKYPNGKEGSVQTDKTVILDGAEQEPETPQYTVSFYLSKEDMNDGTGCYKKYLVYSGKNVTAPKNPSEEDKAFVGWKDGNDYLADFSVPVEQDVTYYAVWN